MKFYEHVQKDSAQYFAECTLNEDYFASGA